MIQTESYRGKKAKKRISELYDQIEGKRAEQEMAQRVTTETNFWLERIFWALVTIGLLMVGLVARVWFPGT